MKDVKRKHVLGIVAGISAMIFISGFGGAYISHQHTSREEEHLKNELSCQKADMERLQVKLYQTETELNKYKESHQELILELEEPRKRKKKETVSRKIVANVSAYTADSDECGKSDGITASGKRATAGRTIAMDGVPFGTQVRINGNIYIVEDRFGGGYSDRIDIFMNSKAEAFNFGRQYIEVEILT